MGRPTAAITTLLACTRPAELEIGFVDDMTLQAVACALIHNSTLRALTMKSCRPTGRGCDAFLHALSGHKSIEQLHWCATCPLISTQWWQGKRVFEKSCSTYGLGADTRVAPPVKHSRPQQMASRNLKMTAHAQSLTAQQGAQHH